MIVYSNYLWIKEKENKERSLVYLYNCLIDFNEKQCELFLDNIMDEYLEQFSKDINAIVHVLNAISPKKNNIKNWEKFVSIIKKKSIEIYGEDETNEFLTVIL